jgi:multiple sugar transport system substrate-binding protein
MNSNRSTPVTLRGITWDHTRGYLPMVASAQRFEELHPGVCVRWEKRSLKDFEEYPVEKLAEDYDLLIIDHPFVGFAARHGPLLPLEAHLPAGFLADQAAQQVGKSHDSYAYGGHQWALAIDAAAPVAFWREDLLERHGRSVPQTWEEVLALARAGHVHLPAAPINCLMNFYMLCVAHGEAPFTGTDRIAAEPILRAALETLRELLEASDPAGWELNPIGSHDRLSAADNETLCYCPLAYGYSNYARDGYAQRRLTFGPPPSFGGNPLRSTLGGTGLALSALRPLREETLAYAVFAASGEVQRTLGTPAGGQPGHRSAWLDETNNILTHGYFRATLPALEAAWVRPRYAGYADFQEAAGPVLHRALRRAADDGETLRAIHRLYLQSLAGAPPFTHP